MNGSRLLIEESPLQVLPSLVLALGMNEAIFLQQLHYLSRKSTLVKDGRVWVRKTGEKWTEELPFWSLPTFRRIVANLKSLGVLLVRDDLNEFLMDRTAAYAVNYEGLDALFVPKVTPPDNDPDLPIVSKSQPPDSTVLIPCTIYKEDQEGEAEGEYDHPSDHMGQSPEAPAPPPQSPEAVSLPAKKVNKQLSAFVQAYQHIWGMMVSSAYEGETIASWESRVTLEGWEYALKESANANARNWKYLTRVLERIEREGIKSQPSASSPAQPKPSSVVDFSLKDILP